MRSTASWRRRRSNEWRVHDFRVTPRVISGGLGLLRSRQPQRQLAVQAKATKIFAAAGAASGALRRSTTRTWTSASCSSSPVRHSSRRTASRPRPAPSSTSFPIRASGRSTTCCGEPHVRASDDAALRRALRRGRMEDRQLADDPSRRPLRAGDAVGDADAGLLAQEQLGAAHRRRLGPDRRPARRRCSRTTAVTTPGCRTTWRRARCRRTPSIIGRLLRCESDAAGARTARVTTNATGGADTTTHFTLLGAGADDIDPNAKLSYYNEWVVGTEYTVPRGHRRRRALHPPRHRASARGRPAVSDRRDLARRRQARRRRTTC